MAKLELLITLETSEKYDDEAADNRRARQKNASILPTADKLAAQVIKTVNSLGYVKDVESCRVMHIVGSQETERREASSPTNGEVTKPVLKVNV